jgi:hypothetical protein
MATTDVALAHENSSFVIPAPFFVIPAEAGIRANAHDWRPAIPGMKMWRSQ